MEQTIHNKETNKTTVYLFQREASKSNLLRCIKDYFKGIKSAGEQVDKHLCGTLHYTDHTFTRMKITNPLERRKNDPSAVGRIINRFGTHIGTAGSKVFSITPNARSNEPSDYVQVKTETDQSFNLKQRWSKVIDSVDPESKKINSSERRHLKKIANYCVDSSSDRSRPKSKEQIKGMLDRLEKFIEKIPNNAPDSKNEIRRLQSFLRIELKEFQ
jgi:hypothetical protein